MGSDTCGGGRRKEKKKEGLTFHPNISAFLPFSHGRRWEAGQDTCFFTAWHKIISGDHSIPGSCFHVFFSVACLSQWEEDGDGGGGGGRTDTMPSRFGPCISQQLSLPQNLLPGSPPLFCLVLCHKHACLPTTLPATRPLPSQTSTALLPGRKVDAWTGRRGRQGEEKRGAGGRTSHPVRQAAESASRQALCTTFCLLGGGRDRRVTQQACTCRH